MDKITDKKKMFDFKDGRGLVPAHRHPNGGGWVADAAHVAESVYVGPSAYVAGGVIRGGVIRGGVIRGGEILGGVIRRGAVIHDGVIRDGVIRGGVIRGGVIRGGVVLGGEIWSSEFRHLTTTDQGHHVVANWIDGEWRVSAGCRDRWTIAEARAHWGAPDYHSPSSGQRILGCLDWLEREPVPEGEHNG